MSLDPTPLGSITSLHTHSLITLQIPPETNDRICYYQWFSQNQDPTRLATSSIFTRFDISKITKNCDYQCTPLDYGTVLIGRILYDNSGEHEIISEFKYGPVLGEKEISSCFLKSERTEVKMTVNKTSLIDAQLKIKKENVHEPGKTTIVVEAQSFKFELKIDKTIRLPSNNSFFKFYEKEDNALGISMYHQHSEFMEKLKELKIYSHFGFYLKIHFKHRQFRDAFLFEIMQNFGIFVPELQESIQSQKQHIQINFQESFVINREEEDHRAVTEKKIIESKQEIDDEIYKLLYEASEKEAESQSIDMVEAEMLFASTNQINIKNSKVLKELKESECKSVEKKNQFLVEKNKNQPENIFYKSDFPCFNSEQKIQEHQKPIDQKRKYFRNVSTTEFINESNSYLRAVISKLNFRIENLSKENKKLSQENKMLRDENMMLKCRGTKSRSNKSISDNIIRTTTTNKDIPLNNTDAPSPRVSPQKHSPYLFRPNRTQNNSKSKFEIDKTLKTPKRNYTTYLNEKKPESTCFMVTSQDYSGLVELNKPHRQSFKMGSETSQLDFIKEEQNNFPQNMLQKFQVKKSKTKEHRTSYDKIMSPSRITNDNFYSRMIPSMRETPSLSQFIPPQLVRTRHYNSASSQHIQILNFHR